MVDEVELLPRRKRRGIAWPVSLTALFVSIALLLNSSSIRIGQGFERDARSQDRATIAQLQAAQAQSAEITNCARKLASNVTDADRDWKHFFTQVLIAPPADEAARTQARDALAAVDARQVAAADAVKAFANNPVLPCPGSG